MSREWEYYNHALVPATAPHVEPDTSWMKDRGKWKELAGGRYPLFARWTTDFDCPEETEWWYIIKEAPFEFENLEKKSRKHIRQALRNCRIEKLENRKQNIGDLYRVYEEAHARYKNADNKISYEQFERGCLDESEDIEYWVGYDSTDRMIGYVTVIVHDTYVETSTAKFSAQYMNLRVSDALYYNILDFYLNKSHKKYVSSGQRSINHITNTQEYKIKVFGFRKAYCRLHIKYAAQIKWLVFMLYPIRKFIKLFDRNTLIHQLSGVLKMEEICREEK